MTIENCGTYDVALLNEKIVVFRSIDELIKAFSSDNEYMDTLKTKLMNTAKLLYSTFNNSSYKEDDIKEACIGLDFNDECYLDVQYDDKEHIYVIYDDNKNIVAKMHYIIDELERFRRVYSKFELLNSNEKLQKNIVNKFVPGHSLSDIMNDKEQFYIPWDTSNITGEETMVYFNILRKPDITQEDFYSSHISDENKLATYNELMDKFDNKSMAEKRRIEIDIILNKIKDIVEAK